MGQKDADGMANIVDPDDIALRQNVRSTAVNHLGFLCPFKGWTLSFLFIVRWMLMNFHLVVYRLRYYFINVLNGLKHLMTKLHH